MADARRKSPRAPSLPLEDALERAMGMYEKERRHEVSVDVAAQDIGYKNANNGAALSALASLRYYGLIDRPGDGAVAIAKEVEIYKFAPEEQVRRDLRRKWLKTPQIFADLLEKYSGALPSDAAIKFELIQRGFTPTTADECVNIFRRSVDFAEYFENGSVHSDAEVMDISEVASISGGDAKMVAARLAQASFPDATPGNDRIPVRLVGNRRAWLEIPSPFFEKDKAQLVAQIGLLLTDEEEDK